MEHKKRKMFAAIAVIMLCAVAIIGVGYAYQASTQNAGNTVNSEYITLYQANGTTPDATGAYKFANNAPVKWNSVDTGTPSGPSAAQTVYTLDGASVIDIDSDGETTTNYTLKQVGNDFVVKADQIGGSVAARTCAITTDITDPVNYDIIVKVVNSTTTYFKVDGSTLQKYVEGSTHDWSSGDGNNTFSIGTTGNPATYVDTTITVYVGYAGTTGVIVPHDVGSIPAAGPESRPVEHPLNGNSLTFTVTVA